MRDILINIFLHNYFVVFSETSRGSSYSEYRCVIRSFNAWTAMNEALKKAKELGDKWAVIDIRRVW